jgi:hypothetical protein
MTVALQASGLSIPKGDFYPRLQHSKIARGLLDTKRLLPAPPKQMRKVVLYTTPDSHRPRR